MCGQTSSTAKNRSPARKMARILRPTGTTLPSPCGTSWTLHTVWNSLMTTILHIKRKAGGSWDRGHAGQRTEDRGQRTEDRGQRTEDRGQRTEGCADADQFCQGLDRLPEGLHSGDGDLQRHEAISPGGALRAR